MRRFVQKLKSNTKFAMQDNRGLTLVELLIAVTILGIVAAPLLHGFLTSAQTEIRARKMGEVTSVAQNVMEVVESNPFETVVAQKLDDTYQIFETPDNNRVSELYYGLAGSSYVQIGEEKPDANDYHIGLKNYVVSGKSYDVMVDVSASAYDTKINNDKMSVNTKMDCVFQIPETPFLRLADRTIKMVIQRNLVDGKDMITVDVEYQLGITPPTKFDTYSYEVKDGKMPSIYLLYPPSYAYSGFVNPVMKDTIIIDNTQAEVRLNLYIMKQVHSGLRNNDLALSYMENRSECQVEQHLTRSYLINDRNIGAKIYTNITENLGDEDDVLSSRNVSYSIICSGIPQPGVSFGNDTEKFKTEEESRKRIYEVTVKVYEKSDGDFTGELLATMTGAVLK